MAVGGVGGGATCGGAFPEEEVKGEENISRIQISSELVSLDKLL